jgi:cation transport ATPase
VDQLTVLAAGSEDELIRLAASLEVGSGHHLARSIVDAARARGLKLSVPNEVIEHPGQGVEGTVDGRRLFVGSLALLRDSQPGASTELQRIHDSTHGLRAYVAADDRAIGMISFADRAREGIAPMLARLRALGLTRIVLLSGDSATNVVPLAQAMGITEARGDLLPDAKVEAVKALERAGHRVMMVGDGTNDAPALSAATVGVALAAHGGGISAEAASVVLLADDITRVEEAVVIGRGAVRIAKQSIFAGLALSGLAMVVAAFGYIPPTLGALLQEAIDVAVIVNALRAARA